MSRAVRVAVVLTAAGMVALVATAVTMPGSGRAPAAAPQATTSPASTAPTEPLTSRTSTAPVPDAPAVTTTQHPSEPPRSGTGHDATTPAQVATAGVAAAGADAASGFVRAWARPNLPPGEWLAGLEPWTGPELLEQLASTDPARVPASTVTGPLDPIATGPYWGRWRVPTDAGPVLVEVVLDRSRWVAVSVQPAPGGG